MKKRECRGRHKDPIFCVLFLLWRYGRTCSLRYSILLPAGCTFELRLAGKVIAFDVCQSTFVYFGILHMYSRYVSFCLLHLLNDTLKSSKMYLFLEQRICMLQVRVRGVTKQSQRMEKIGPIICKYMLKRVKVDEYLLVIVIFSHIVLG